MQRRAGAAFVVFFLLVGAASLALVTTASPPEFDVDGQQLEQGDSFEVDGQTYNVESVSASEGGGGDDGHGGGGGGETTYEAVFNWTNESYQYTESWKNNSTVTVDDTEWTVLVNEGGNGSFVLREDVNETQILQNDPDAGNETVTYEDEPHVVVTRNGSEELVPASEYFPDPETRQLSTDDQFDYNGNQTTVTAVTNTSAEVQWTAPKTQTTSATQQGNVTLGDTTFFAHFESEDGVVISQDFQQLERFNEEESQFHEMQNGLWGVAILSATLVVLVLGMAFLPSRY